jgi:hypothetical protein
MGDQPPTYRPFEVIEGTPKGPAAVRRRIRKMPKPAEMLQCPRCGGRALIETKIGMEIRRGGKPSGGTKQMICGGPCLSEGLRTVVW